MNTMAQRQKHLPLREKASEGGPLDEPEESALSERARRYGQVAREAYESCEKGAEATARMHRRRQGSGQ